MVALLDRMLSPSVRPPLSFPSVPEWTLGFRDDFLTVFCRFRALFRASGVIGTFANAVFIA